CCAYTFIYVLLRLIGKHDRIRTAPALLAGWQLNPIVTLQSGNVISVTANAPAFGGGRPDLIGDPSVSNPTIDNWLNKAAFAPIQPFTYGNAPRNLPRPCGPTACRTLTFGAEELPPERALQGTVPGGVL
ncbi:MAG: hypothetical protein QM757_12035, partial [Paludibaculum sp.]